MRYFIALLVFAAVLVTMPSLSRAQAFEKCDGTPITSSVQSEMSAHGRTFANGSITIFVHYVDTYLPNGTLIGVLHPIRGDLAGSAVFPGCTAIYSHRDEIGYFNAAFPQQATADYDPKLGLSIDLPVRHYVGKGKFQDEILTLIINQNDGTISTP